MCSCDYYTYDTKLIHSLPWFPVEAFFFFNSSGSFHFCLCFSLKLSNICQWRVPREDKLLPNPELLTKATVGCRWAVPYLGLNCIGCYKLFMLPWDRDYHSNLPWPASKDALAACWLLFPRIHIPTGARSSQFWFSHSMCGLLKPR